LLFKRHGFKAHFTLGGQCSKSRGFLSLVRLVRGNPTHSEEPLRTTLFQRVDQLNLKALIPVIHSGEGTATTGHCLVHNMDCKLSRSDIHVGGPLCQKFSPMGLQTGEEDGPSMMTFGAWASTNLQLEHTLIVLENSDRFQLQIMQDVFGSYISNTNDTNQSLILKFELPDSGLGGPSHSHGRTLGRLRTGSELGLNDQCQIVCWSSGVKVLNTHASDLCCVGRSSAGLGGGDGFGGLAFCCRT
jgi:hypothetical protein